MLPERADETVGHGSGVPSSVCRVHPPAETPPVGRMPPRPPRAPVGRAPRPAPRPGGSRTPTHCRARLRRARVRARCTTRGDAPGGTRTQTRPAPRRVAHPGSPPARCRARLRRARVRVPGTPARGDAPGREDAPSSAPRPGGTRTQTRPAPRGTHPGAL